MCVCVCVCVCVGVQVCQFCVSSVVRHGMQILQVEDRTILVNNTSLALSYKALLSEHGLASSNEVHNKL